MNRKDVCVNEAGHLMFAGMDTVELAGKFGTPLYVMDENLIRENMRLYRDSIDAFYGGKGLVCYASKAFSCREIYRIAQEEGIGVDVVSMGELYTAMSAGFDPAKVCYHGNNKTVEELRYALECGVGRIIVDAFDEIDLLEELAGQMGKQAGILLRLSPGISAHTHDFIRTGSIDSKFGFAISLGDAMKAVKQALSKPHLNLLGVHAHIGSQIFELDPFIHEAEVLIAFLAEVRKETGRELTELNLGGGFGIRYTDADDPIAYDKYMEAVSRAIRQSCDQQGVSAPFVLMEPGRSIVGNAGITLYRVGAVKPIEGIRTYVAVDGGMTDNIRYALYGAEYEFTLANRAAEEKTMQVTVAGRCCESGDLLGENISLQPCRRGDILAVFATGAYNYSMASNYNRVPRPAVVMVRDGQARLAVRRESMEDLIRNDL